jgi:hypothetical protein
VTPIILEIDLPDYRLPGQPDWDGIGRRVESVILRSFPDAELAVRGIGLIDHPGLDVHALADLVLLHGTDRYDPNRRPYAHELYDPQGVELHAVPISTFGEIRSDHFEPPVMSEFFEIFDEGCRADRGYPIRLDMLILYRLDDLRRLDADPRSCEFAFRQAGTQPVGLIKILGPGGPPVPAAGT